MITQNPNIQGGSPTIKGTRITVLEILQAVESGFSFKKIISRSNYASIRLNEDQIKEAIKYAYTHLINK